MFKSKSSETWIGRVQLRTDWYALAVRIIISKEFAIFRSLPKLAILHLAMSPKECWLLSINGKQDRQLVGGRWSKLQVAVESLELRTHKLVDWPICLPTDFGTIRSRFVACALLVGYTLFWRLVANSAIRWCHLDCWPCTSNGECCL